MSNNKLAKKKSIAEKIAEKTHTSKRIAMQNINYYQAACKNKDFLNNLSNEFDLNEDEVAWLTK